MKWMIVGTIACALVWAATPVLAESALAADDQATAGAVVQTSDVDLFYRVYEAADGRPTAEQLQRDYLDQGSDGLQLFIQLRNITGERIADTLAAMPAVYADARRCMAVLPRARERLEAALQTLGHLYPEARFPPITIAIGRGKPVAVAAPDTGIQSGSRPCAPSTGSIRMSRIGSSMSSPTSTSTSSRYGRNRLPTRKRPQCSTSRWSRASPSSSPS